jgi:hypothetical protein
MGGEGEREEREERERREREAVRERGKEKHEGG